MDAQVLWLRRRITRALVTRVLVVVVLASAGLFCALHFASGLSPDDALPVAILGGQVAALVAVALSMVLSPLDARYFQSYTDQPLHLVSAVIEGHPAVGADDLQLHPAGTIHDPDAGDGAVYDLFQSPNRAVTAAVGRDSGTVALISGLSDGRILHTHDLLVPPHRRLIVNTVPGADIAALAESHRAKLRELALLGIRPAPATPEIVTATLYVEREAYRGLGPILGSFCNFDLRPSLVPMRVRVSPKELLELALPSPASA